MDYKRTLENLIRSQCDQLIANLGSILLKTRVSKIFTRPRGLPQGIAVGRLRVLLFHGCNRYRNLSTVSAINKRLKLHMHSPRSQYNTSAGISQVFVFVVICAAADMLKTSVFCCTAPRSSQIVVKSRFFCKGK